MAPEPAIGDEFDRVVVVDWSANSTPKTGRDSIWIGVRERGVVSSTNISTRRRAVDHLIELALSPGRCLIGVDFSLGFPAGTASMLGLDAPLWRSMWSLLESVIDDRDDNANNRFDVAAQLNARLGDAAGPFWGCPPARASDWLTTTKVPCDPLDEWRLIEARLRSDGRRPFSSWQLLGAGAVGSQSLLGIAALSSFIRQLDRAVDVWPFTCGLEVPTAEVVVAEVWPSLVELPATSDPVWEDAVRDELQVESLCTHLAGLDVAAAFAVDLPERQRSVVVTEEGWVLGV